MAIFAEREAQFSVLITAVRDNIARVRGDIAQLRTQRTSGDQRGDAPHS